MDSARRLQNIQVRKSRRTRWTDTAEILSSLDSLEKLIENGGIERGVYDFVPIRLVTILENFVRDWIAMLVDIGEPFQPRAEKIVKTVKFDYILSMAMHGREVSPGDIAADAISVNSLTAITSVFDVLLNQSTMKLVAEAADDEGTLYVTDIDELTAVVARVFDVRHTVVHEWPADRPYVVSDLKGFIKNVGTFALALDAALGTKLWYNDPNRVRDVLQRNMADLREAENQLSSVVEKLISTVPDKETEIRTAHQRWIEFSAADTKMHEVIRANPVIPEILSAAHLEFLTEWRTAELSSLLSDLKG